MLDTVRGYAAVAAGLAEAGARAAWSAVGSLAPGGSDDDGAGSIPSRVAGMTDGVVASGKQNSELLVGLVRTEVDRAVGRLGFVREEELAAVRRHVQRLQDQLERVTRAAGMGPSAADDEDGQA